MDTVTSLFNRVLNRFSPHTPRRSNSETLRSSPSSSRRPVPSPTDNNSSRLNNNLVGVVEMGDSNSTAGTGTDAGTATGVAVSTSNNNNSSTTWPGTETPSRVTRSRTRARGARDGQATTTSTTQTDGPITGNTTTSPSTSTSFPRPRPSIGTDGHSSRPGYPRAGVVTVSGRRGLGADVNDNGNAHIHVQPRTRSRRNVDVATASVGGMLPGRALSSSINANANGNTSKPFRSAEQCTKHALLGLSEGDENENNQECAVCLLPCIHPVQLPCSHIFCYLCVKGVANQSKRCALCRQEIPVDFLKNPALLHLDHLLKEWQLQEGILWYYEGRNGWWQYDQRTSQELEEKYYKEEQVFELLIAGFLYVIDMKNMIQIRRNDPTRRRRIKRDVASIPDKKGVAGLKVRIATSVGTPERKQGDGGEAAAVDAGGASSLVQGAATAATGLQTAKTSSQTLDAQSDDSVQAAKDAKSEAASLVAPTNSPEHPASGSLRNEEGQETGEEDEADNTTPQMTALRLAQEQRQTQIPRMRRRRRHHHRHLGTHYLDTPDTSSNSDYDC